MVGDLAGLGHTQLDRRSFTAQGMESVPLGRIVNRPLIKIITYKKTYFYSPAPHLSVISYFPSTRTVDDEEGELTFLKICCCSLLIPFGASSSTSSATVLEVGHGGPARHQPWTETPETLASQQQLWRSDASTSKDAHRLQAISGRGSPTMVRAHEPLLPLSCPVPLLVIPSFVFLVLSSDLDELLLLLDDEPSWLLPPLPTPPTP